MDTIIKMINNYLITTDGVYKKTFNKDDTVIDTKMDTWIKKNMSKDDRQFIISRLQSLQIITEIKEIQLSHYRSPADTILIDSDGNIGYELIIKYNDTLIFQTKLCIDDFSYGTKEDKINNILNNNLYPLQKNYIDLVLYLIDTTPNLLLHKSYTAIDAVTICPISPTSPTSPPILVYGGVISE